MTTSLEPVCGACGLVGGHGTLSAHGYGYAYDIQATYLKCWCCRTDYNYAGECACTRNECPRKDACQKRR